MGMRIHKAIGFGLHNALSLMTKKKHKAFDKACETFQEMSSEELQKWVRENQKDIESLYYSCSPEGFSDIPFFLSEDPATYDVFHRLLWEPEFGFPEAVLIRPLYGAKFWYRCNDDIDYIEERGDMDETPSNRFLYLDKGIHPYPQGHPPATVAAVCLFVGLGHLFPKLRESLYVYWS